MFSNLKTLPSRIIPSLKALFQRFPVATVLIILEFIGLLVYVEIENKSLNGQQQYIYGTILMANYALTMFSIALQLFLEKLELVSWKKIAAFITLILTVVIFVYLIDYKDILSYDILGGSATGNTYRLLVLMGLATASSFILPFIKEKNSQEWWNFTLVTASRAVISSLYSVAIFAGLALALFAIESFWDFKFFDNQYIYLAITSFVLILPLHFLNGLYDLKNPQKLIDLPKFLLILVKFILTPLIAVYTLILYPYIFSFPFREEWPANVATGVILALLAMIYIGLILLYGIKEKDNDEKFKILYIKITSAIAIPTIIFWAYSLYLRINAYGMSIDRFVLMSIIIWFLAMAVLYLLKPKTNIKYLTGSLFVLIFSVFYLPFTAYFWSERSQIQGLISLAKEEGTFTNNVIVKGEKAKNGSNHYAMNDKLTYIHDNFGLDGLKSNLSQNIQQDLNINAYGYSSTIDNYYSSSSMAIFFTKEPDSSRSGSDIYYFYIYLDSKNITIPSGYTKVNYYEGYSSDTKIDSNNNITIKGKKFEIKLDVQDSSLQDHPSVMTEGTYQTHNKYTSDISKMSFKSTDNSSLLIVNKFNIDNLKGVISNDYKIQSFTGYVFSN